MLIDAYFDATIAGGAYTLMARRHATMLFADAYHAIPPLFSLIFLRRRHYAADAIATYYFLRFSLILPLLLLLHSRYAFRRRLPR